MSAHRRYSLALLLRWASISRVSSSDVSFGRSDSIGYLPGTYSNIGGDLSASRQILPSIHLIVRYSARQYQSPNFANYNRLVHEARIGLGWTPGDLPLRIW